MTNTSTTLRESADHRLRSRAARVVPGGMYGHQRAGLFPANFPQFLAGGNGAIIRDVDGREFIDFLLGYGPMVLGYQHPAVEEAAARQRALADCQNAPSERMVELAELLVDMVDHADWAYFAKNGTDATTTALTIARAATGRAKILVERHSYHGAAPWCTPGVAGIQAADRENIVYFDYNDLASLRDAFAEADGDLAGVIITPFKHNDGVDQELITAEFAGALRTGCDAAGAVLILDDVRCGMRLHLGSSWRDVDVEPDLSVWGKAISNGYAVSAILGRESLRDAATSIFSTGTFWFAAVPMAAALATIAELRRIDGVGLQRRAGDRFKAGLVDQANAAGFEIAYTGPSQMPYLRFVDDVDHKLSFEFSEAALEHGVYLHPRHNWFVSTAHTDEVIDRALEGTGMAFNQLASAR
ncbi:aminotransferase class III-fold pyridoxal phosphate-dependent enzyme [Nocardioides soli]|uniref:Glutamate-1-semialdehyde 2,1-aminomutase n=1 Tax=Nocardioides soli TaxID=1036020 RepID=A0A7W4VXX4_9ACTN|nr:aminotransferase class III-fold pyridoxal phosphate-dependent enzyme [Nocardioides soli]MBB3043826.1 glutamate-1-semialdehyde 2,1-aminomutase [Nocardioides soli]